MSICAVLLTGAILWQKSGAKKEKPDQFIQEKESLNRLLQNSSEIHRIWTEGEDSREWSLLKTQCLKYYGITSSFDESLLRCNPMLLQCNGLFNKKLNYHFVKPELEKDNKKLYRSMTKSNSNHVGLNLSGYLFTIEDNISRKRLDLFLADSCQEVFLENRAYAYGEELIGKAARETEDYRFDNFGQNIYIDRHLVTNAEINDWIDFGDPGHTKGLVKKESNELFLPAIHLLYAQMENFCSFKGKQMLLAHYADAASFLPMDLTEILPKKNTRSPYFWTKKKNEFNPDCNLIYAEDCLTKKPFQLNSTGPTWAGIMDPTGGVLEIFRNPIDPESNLKASSFYFNFKSPWHKLGFRAKWDGEGFDLRHFDFRGINPEQTVESFQVGFRCMRESQ
jgi:hypothetical protein